MLKIEKFVTASPEQWKMIIEGMRNPLNSWDKSDSFTCEEDVECNPNCPYTSNPGSCPVYDLNPDFIIGQNDHSLMERLDNAGTEHRKFMRMIPVWVTLSAPLYWWKEADTYKVGTTRNSCSTMHKIQTKEFTLEDFSCEHSLKDCVGNNKDSIWYKDPPENSPIKCPLMFTPLDTLRITIGVLNTNREAYLKTNDKKYWWQMIQLLPSSYNQKATLFLNYEVLSNIYHQRKNHKLDEWHTFCDWIRELPYSELITRELE